MLKPHTKPIPYVGRQASPIAFAVRQGIRKAINALPNRHEFAAKRLKQNKATKDHLHKPPIHLA
eukprot:7436161-Heterocapsa_arctica.AAC.1